MTLGVDIAQVCDDSTREDVRRRIDAKVSEMSNRGHHCLVTRRDANKGFKVIMCLIQQWGPGA